jgi:hypothetical protein
MNNTRLLLFSWIRRGIFYLLSAKTIFNIRDIKLKIPKQVSEIPGLMFNTLMQESFHPRSYPTESQNLKKKPDELDPVSFESVVIVAEEPGKKYVDSKPSGVQTTNKKKPKNED